MGLNRTDYLIIALYLAGITLFGLRFRKKQRSLRDYFLAGRDIPWWAIALSIVAAETSTLTIISVPGIAYDTNFTFLQLVMGYVVGRVVISFVLLPHYFRGDLYTAYELIERRFGRGSARICGVDCSVDRAGDRRGDVDCDYYRIDGRLYV
jgi:solute:Na+ symporter, SSS family